MKSVFFAIVAMLIYTSTSLIIEQKLSKLPTSVIMVGMNFILFTFSTIFFTTQVQEGTATIKVLTDNWVIVFILGAMYCAGDYCLFSAYHLRGDVRTITTVVALMPVCACIGKYFLTGHVPNVYHVLACVLAILAVICATKANMLTSTS